MRSVVLERMGCTALSLLQPQSPRQRQTGASFQELKSELDVGDQLALNKGNQTWNLARASVLQVQTHITSHHPQSRVEGDNPTSGSQLLSELKQHVTRCQHQVEDPDIDP
ncbi:hypothetical protein STEG23_036880 [Scotinomys teguina]